MSEKSSTSFTRSASLCLRSAGCWQRQSPSKCSGCESGWRHGRSRERPGNSKYFRGYDRIWDTHMLDTVTMNSIQKNQDGRAVVATAEVPEWWARVPAEERQVLSELMRMVRGLKQSRVPQVARAARAWECTLGCFIKVRLMNSLR